MDGPGRDFVDSYSCRGVWRLRKTRPDYESRRWACQTLRLRDFFAGREGTCRPTQYLRPSSRSTKPGTRCIPRP